MRAYTAIVHQDGDRWIGWINEVRGVNCQEATKDKLMESLRIALKEAIELDKRDTVQTDNL